MPARDDGSIRIHEDAFHMEVEWDFAYPRGCARSPAFTYGNQGFRLAMYVSAKDLVDHVYIYLDRVGPACTFPDVSLRWWAGLKDTNGAYYRRNESGTLDLGMECEKFCRTANLMSLRTQEVEGLSLVSKGWLTFFLRLCSRRSSAAEECVPGAIDVSARDDGYIRIDENEFHKEVVWDFAYPRDCVRSPLFTHKNQSYQLAMYVSTMNAVDYAYVYVDRMGPACLIPDAAVRWFAGLKRSDGAYYHRIERGTLDLRLECEKFYRAANLICVRTKEIERHGLTSEGRLTFFLRLCATRTSSAAEACVPGASDMLRTGDGEFLEEECSSHKEVQWKVRCYPVKYLVRNLVSPVFAVGKQHYLLELSFIDECNFFLNLFRMGPFFDGSVRWWAGLKSEKEICSRRIESKKLDLWRSCKMWQKVESLKTVTFDEVLWNLSEDCITLFLRISKEENSDVAFLCNREHPTHSLSD